AIPKALLKRRSIVETAIGFARQPSQRVPRLLQVWIATIRQVRLAPLWRLSIPAEASAYPQHTRLDSRLFQEGLPCEDLEWRHQLSSSHRKQPKFSFLFASRVQLHLDCRSFIA